MILRRGGGGRKEPHQSSTQVDKGINIHGAAILLH